MRSGPIGNVTLGQLQTDWDAFVAADDALPPLVLNLVLDTDDGGGIVTKESDDVGGILLMIGTITAPRNPAARTNGQPQRCRGSWFIGAMTDRCSSARS